MIATQGDLAAGAAAIDCRVNQLSGSDDPGARCLALVIIRSDLGPALVDTADASDDLLIIGRRPGVLSRASHGRVSRYCFAHAHCPVLTIPLVTAALSRVSRATPHRELFWTASRAIGARRRLQHAAHHRKRDGVMDDRLPQQLREQTLRRSRLRRAAWCVGAGVILAIAAAMTSALGAVSVQQAIAMGLPAAVLIIGGLTAAVLPDAATGRRLSFRAGFRVGSLVTSLGSVIRRPRA